eukprot:CAMPEP_0184505158 /NCGR_PEP_ID=MMETSP0113_2-20130426/52843_1 /TAXON_ID=91329 /ORGANISM="Norrisiella sphaerica, Strain BC52" /LENGTH=83 /DNA_ID=CAMNT_0026894837 /DNA_START=368 /DNA_END=616 /DNA_ORIENTATION=+
MTTSSSSMGASSLSFASRGLGRGLTSAKDGDKAPEPTAASEPRTASEPGAASEPKAASEPNVSEPSAWFALNAITVGESWALW